MKTLKTTLSVLISLFILLLIVSGCERFAIREKFAEIETPNVDSEKGDDFSLYPVDGIHGLLSMVEYGDNKAYIFGSYHFGRSYWYPLNQVVEKAITESDVFVFEFDPTRAGLCLHEEPPYCNDYECTYVQELRFLDNGITLDEYLPQDVFEHLSEVLTQLPYIHYDTISTFIPIVAYEEISSRMYAAEFNLRPEQGVDNYIGRKAVSSEKLIAGLLDYNEHFLYMYNMPLESQTAAIRYLDIENERQGKRESISSYEFNDVERIAQFRGDYDEVYKAYVAGEIPEDAWGYIIYWHDILRIQRDSLFADEISRLLMETEEPTTFFVTVGVAHLAGENVGNVFDFLEDLGYEVVRIYE